MMAEGSAYIITLLETSSKHGLRAECLLGWGWTSEELGGQEEDFKDNYYYY